MVKKIVRLNLKNIYLLVGPSGSGKSTIADILIETYKLKQVQSYTDRPPRFAGESGHTFVSKEEFDALENLCAYTEFAGHRYGVPAEMVDDCDIYVIDPAGVRYLREHYHGARGIRAIGLYSAPEVCRKRMLLRGDTEASAAERLAHDRMAFAPLEKGEPIPNRVALSGLRECCDIVFFNNYVGDNLARELAGMLYRYIQREEGRQIY